MFCCYCVVLDQKRDKGLYSCVAGCYEEPECVFVLCDRKECVLLYCVVLV